MFFCVFSVFVVHNLSNPILILLFFFLDINGALVYSSGSFEALCRYLRDGKGGDFFFSSIIIFVLAIFGYNYCS